MKSEEGVVLNTRLPQALAGTVRSQVETQYTVIVFRLKEKISGLVNSLFLSFHCTKSFTKH